MVLMTRKPVTIQLRLGVQLRLFHQGGDYLLEAFSPSKPRGWLTEFIWLK